MIYDSWVSKIVLLFDGVFQSKKTFKDWDTEGGGTLSSKGKKKGKRRKIV